MIVLSNCSMNIVYVCVLTSLSLVHTVCHSQRIWIMLLPPINSFCTNILYRSYLACLSSHTSSPEPSLLSLSSFFGLEGIMSKWALTSKRSIIMPGWPCQGILWTRKRRIFPLACLSEKIKMKVIMISAYCVYMVAGLSAAAAMAGSMWILACLPWIWRNWAGSPLVFS